MSRVAGVLGCSSVPTHHVCSMCYKVGAIRQLDALPSTAATVYHIPPHLLGFRTNTGSTNAGFITIVITFIIDHQATTHLFSREL